MTSAPGTPPPPPESDAGPFGAGQRKRWAAGVSRRARAAGCDPRRVVATAAQRVAAALGATPDPLVADLAVDVPPVGVLIDPPSGWADPWLLSALHEQAAGADERKARGAWYTSRPVAAGLVRLATWGRESEPELFVDLTCGGGAFLLAALDHLVARGTDPVAAVGRVAGMDLDIDAVAVSRWSVLLWLTARAGPDAAAEVVAAGGTDAFFAGKLSPDASFPAKSQADEGQGAGIDLRVGDSLDETLGRWGDARLCIVGNPPFASPLKSGAVPTGAAAYREQHAELLGPYADIAAAHLLRAVELAGPGSVVALVQPQSVLSSRDTEQLRHYLGETAPLQALWVAREAVFDAGVRTCAPVLEVGGQPSGRVTLASGPEVVLRNLPAPSQSWGCLGAEALGAPSLPPMSGRLGELAPATAGFRDEHYGLVAACREGNPCRSDTDCRSDTVGRLVTVGSVDPLTVAWGRELTRFGGRKWDCPVIDPEALTPKVRAWYERQRRPKVLLATQAKLLEPVVDRSGDLVPATPLIAVHAQPEELDRVAAVLLAPPVVVWAWRRWFGTAMAVDAVKLAAGQVAELPLPVDEDAWGEAAALVRQADGVDPTTAWDLTVAVAEKMTSAYGAADEVFEWWRARLKPRPKTGSSQSFGVG